VKLWTVQAPEVAAQLARGYNYSAGWALVPRSWAGAYEVMTAPPPRVPLRHTGNQFTANAGANTRELMVRMGHDSERAALIYLHSSDARQRALADAVAEAARAELAQSKNIKKSGRSGTRKARRQHDTPRH
jgi:hypothetical protein